MKQEILDELVGFLGGMEKDIKRCHDEAMSRRKFTTKVIKVTLAAMFVLMVFCAYFLFQLSSGLNDSLEIVDEMASDFGEVGAHLSQVTVTMASMDEQVSHLPGMAINLASMREQTSTMDASTQQIAASFTDVNIKLRKVENGMVEIDRRMDGISRDVNGMEQSVDQLSRPARIMNSFMPW